MISIVSAILVLLSCCCGCAVIRGGGGNKNTSSFVFVDAFSISSSTTKFGVTRSSSNSSKNKYNQDRFFHQHNQQQQQQHDNLLPLLSPHGKISTALHSSQPFKVSGMWNNGLSFGKGPFRFYKNFDSWMSPFPQQDRDMYPEIFTFPKGVYEVSMVKPLGIIFEEIDIGKGVYVVDLVEGGNAEQMGTIKRGDVLVGITAVKVIGAKWERRLIPAKDLSFDTVVGAIGSNDEKWGCEDVVLWFMRPEEVEDVKKVDDFLLFFNPPGDSAWRTA